MSGIAPYHDRDMLFDALALLQVFFSNNFWTQINFVYLAFLPLVLLVLVLRRVGWERAIFSFFCLASLFYVCFYFKSERYFLPGVMALAILIPTSVYACRKNRAMVLALAGFLLLSGMTLFHQLATQLKPH